MDDMNLKRKKVLILHPLCQVLAIYQSSDEIVDTPILRFRRHVGGMVATAKSTGHNPIIQFQALYFFFSLSSFSLSLFMHVWAGTRFKPRPCF